MEVDLTRPSTLIPKVVKAFVPVKIPGNYLPKAEVFRGVIAGYSADLDQYSTDTWAEFVLKEAQGYTTCKSLWSYAGLNSGGSGRYWFGYISTYGPVDTSDFHKADERLEVSDARAFSIWN